MFLTMEELLPFEKVKRSVLVKQEAQTNEAYGMKPDKRSVEQLINYGILNLNKPAGPR